MKKKITISIEENILWKIDNLVKHNKWKNRSAVIEKALLNKFGDFVDMTVIIFAHDYKWDNRNYPFDIPKALLKIKNRTVADLQIEAFTKAGVNNVIFLIPPKSTELFKNELLPKYRDIRFDFVELDPNLKTWSALREALKRDFTDKELMIANWDIFYWNLNIKEYYDYHKEQKSDFSMLLKFVLNAEQLWNVWVHGNQIIKFVDRPNAKYTYLTNSWLYITTRKFLDENDFWDYLEYDFFPILPKLNKNIIAYMYPWEWEHIQNDSAYERVNWWLM